MLEKMKNKIEKMESDNEFLPKNPDKNCYWCDYKKECSVYEG